MSDQAENSLPEEVQSQLLAYSELTLNSKWINGMAEDSLAVRYQLNMKDFKLRMTPWVKLHVELYNRKQALPMERVIFWDKQGGVDHALLS